MKTLKTNMKPLKINTSLKRTIVAIAMAFGIGVAAHGAVVVIDTTTNNGSFEGPINDQPAAAPWVAGDTTSLSTPVAISNTKVKFDATAPDGTKALEFTSAGAGQGQGAIQNTGYVLGSVSGGGNEFFNLSFDWKDQFGFDGTPADQGVQVELFYSSDNTLGGTLTSLYVADYTDPTPGVSDGWTTQISSSGLSGGAGQELWIVFSARNTDSSYVGRIDNVQLSVAQVTPEPASLALFGMGALVMFSIRRKKKIQ